MIENKYSTKWIFIIGGAIFLLLSALYLTFGLYSLNLSDWKEAINNSDSYLRVLIFDIRLPRLALALFLGCGLSAAGMTCQNVIRNDLATPGILGVISGCQFGITLAVMFASTVSPIMSFAFGMITMLITLLLSIENGRISTQRILLIGIAISALLGSATGVFSLFMRVESFNYITAFMSSSLTKANWGDIKFAAPIIMIGCFLIYKMSATMNAIRLGDEAAVSLGVKLDTSRLYLLFIAVAITAISVSVGGGFAFLGLLAPHIARRIVGSDTRKIMLACLIIGPGLLVISECITRWLFPLTEIPAGVFISALGTPYFLYLLVKNGRRSEVANA